MKFVFCFVLGWCLIWACIANAMGADGSGLLENCQAYLKFQSGSSPGGYVNGVQNGMCVAYVQGVIETGQIWHEVVGLETYCLPEISASSDQFIRVVVQYLENHPADLHHTAAALVQRAFMEAFPCTEGEQ